MWSPSFFLGHNGKLSENNVNPLVQSRSKSGMSAYVCLIKNVYFFPSGSVDVYLEISCIQLVQRTCFSVSLNVRSIAFASFVFRPLKTARKQKILATTTKKFQATWTQTYGRKLTRSDCFQQQARYSSFLSLFIKYGRYIFYGRYEVYVETSCWQFL